MTLCQFFYLVFLFEVLRLLLLLRVVMVTIFTRSRAQTITEIGGGEDEGFVYKRGKWLGAWKRRYFIRKGHLLYCFEADESHKQPIHNSRTTFDLNHWKFEKSNEKNEKKQFLFRLSHCTIKQSYLLAVATESEQTKWLVGVNGVRIKIKYLPHEPKIIICQAQMRMHVRRVEYRRLRKAAVAIQSKYKMYCTQNWYKKALVSVVKCQSVVRRFTARRKYKKLQRRKRIVGEMLSTEQTYVVNLRTVIELFSNPLKASAQSPVTQILSHEEIKVLFGPLEPVHQVNSEFCSLLDTAMKNWNLDQKIGDMFIRAADKFKFVYVPYVLNYGEVCIILEKIRKKNTKFRDFLEAAIEDTRSRGLDISSFLIQPVQRLPRYELLLKDLIKHTPSNHPDLEDLNKGLQRINEVAIFINEKKRDKENVSLVTNLQQILEGKLTETIKWKPHHRLIREGEGQSTTNKKVNYIILINDFILLIQKQKTTHHLREIITLNDVAITLGRSDATEQITFEKGGEKAAIIVPLAQNLWSADVLLLVVAYQERKDHRNSLILLRTSDNLPGPGSPPLSPVSSPKSSALSPSSSSSTLSPTLSFTRTKSDKTMP